jgi:hypothetical protein
MAMFLNITDDARDEKNDDRGRKYQFQELVERFGNPIFKKGGGNETGNHHPKTDLGTPITFHRLLPFLGPTFGLGDYLADGLNPDELLGIGVERWQSIGIHPLAGLGNTDFKLYPFCLE